MAAGVEPVPDVHVDLLTPKFAPLRPKEPSHLDNLRGVLGLEVHYVRQTVGSNVAEITLKVATRGGALIEHKGSVLGGEGEADAGFFQHLPFRGHL